MHTHREEKENLTCAVTVIPFSIEFNFKGLQMNGKNEDNTLRILIIGDCKIGKTSLLLKYLLNNDTKNTSADTLDNIDSNDSKLDFLHKYKPTTLSIYKCQVNINSSMYNILFTDPNGNNQDEKLADLRKNFYIYDNVCSSLLSFHFYYSSPKY